jgi:hypothetical protein
MRFRGNTRSRPGSRAPLAQTAQFALDPLDGQLQCHETPLKVLDLPRADEGCDGGHDRRNPAHPKDENDHDHGQFVHATPPRAG